MLDIKFSGLHGDEIGKDSLTIKGINGSQKYEYHPV